LQRIGGGGNRYRWEVVVYVYCLEKKKRQSTEWMGRNIGTIDENFCYLMNFNHSYLPIFYIILYNKFVYSVQRALLFGRVKFSS